MSNIKLLRDAPSQETFVEREAKLLDSTKELEMALVSLEVPVLIFTMMNIKFQI